MNPWVERALLSVAASAVSTAMWVTTAKNPTGSKRRRKVRKKRGQKSGAAPDRSPVPRSPGAQAVRDHENGHRDGLSAGEFLENLQRSGTRNVARIAQLRAWLKNDPSTSSTATKGQDAEQKSDSQSKPADVADTVLDEAKKAAKKHIQNEVASRTGLSNASEKWQETSASLKNAGDKISASVKQKMPENWSKGVGEAGRNVKDALAQAGQNVREGLETDGHLGEKLDQGIRDLGRWIQGPGAPQNDLETKDTQDAAASVQNEGDWVEARMPEEKTTAGELADPKIRPDEPAANARTNTSNPELDD